MKIILAAAAAALTLAGAQPLPLAVPKASWVVDFDDNFCIAGREFALNGKDVVVGLRPDVTGNRFSVYVQAPRKLKGWEDERVKVTVGQRVAADERLIVEPVSKAGYSRYSFHLTADEKSALIDTGELSVQSETVSARFTLSDVAKVAKVLDACVTDLLDFWGMSKEIQASVATFPSFAAPAITPEDYPSYTMDREGVGVVEILVMVGADGKPADCRVLRSSGWKDLDETTCRVIMKRGRFNPATDKAGKPIPSPYATSVRWGLG